MKTKESKIVTLVIMFLLGLFLFFGLSDHSDALIIRTSSGEHPIYLEVAESHEEKRLGLMGREFLEDEAGMLFLYDEGGSPVIWMKNMQIALDILFISPDLHINHVEENAEPCTFEDDSQCLRYRSSETTRYVLEIPAGTAKKLAIQEGDEVQLPELLR